MWMKIRKIPPGPSICQERTCRQFSRPHGEIRAWLRSVHHADERTAGCGRDAQHWQMEHGLCGGIPERTSAIGKGYGTMTSWNIRWRHHTTGQFQLRIEDAVFPKCIPHRKQCSKVFDRHFCSSFLLFHVVIYWCNYSLTFCNDGAILIRCILCSFHACITSVFCGIVMWSTDFFFKKTFKLSLTWESDFRLGLSSVDDVIDLNDVNDDISTNASNTFCDNHLKTTQFNSKSPFSSHDIAQSRLRKSVSISKL